MRVRCKEALLAHVRYAAVLSDSSPPLLFCHHMIHTSYATRAERANQQHNGPGQLRCCTLYARLDLQNLLLYVNKDIACTAPDE